MSKKKKRKNNNTNEALSIDDVQEVLETYNYYRDAIINKELKDFDYELFASEYQKSYNNKTSFNPMSINKNMQDANFSPMITTLKDVEAALATIKSGQSQEKLIEYNQQFYLTSMLYKREFNYLADLLSWDLGFETKSRLTKKEYDSDKFNKDYNAVGDFLYKFDYRKWFSKTTFNMMAYDTVYCQFRTDVDENKYILQYLPYEYCMITGDSPYGYTFDFNFSYFSYNDVDIELYSPWFQKTYKKLLKDNKLKPYDPAMSYQTRDSSSDMWVQTNIQNGFYCFKLEESWVASIPYLSAAMTDFATIPLMRRLQSDLNMKESKRILTSSIGLLKEAKGATAVSDRVAVKPETLAKFFSNVDKAIDIQMINIPADDIKVYDFKNESKTVYDESLKNTASTLNGGRAVFTGDKPNAIESNMSFAIDDMFVTKLYSQFQDFFDYFINHLAVKKYKFDFKFNFTNSIQSKKEKKDLATFMATYGMNDLNLYANVFGLNRIELENRIDLTYYSNNVEKFRPLSTSFTQASSPSSSSGRPQSNENDLTDSALVSREQGSNVAKGGEV